MFAARYFNPRYWAERYWPKGAAVSSNTGPGRLEYTIPRSTLEFAVQYDPLDYTLPKTVEEFGVETP